MTQPKLIVIGGFAGAGKTTISKRLSRQYNYPIFSSDTINDSLRVVLGKSFKEVSPMAYEIMWFLVRKQLENGVTVIIDAHMAAPHTWESLDNLSSNIHDVTVIPIILQADLEVHQKRVEERGRTDKDHLNLGGDSFDDVTFKYDYIEKLNRPDLIRISANGTADQVYKLVDQAINEYSP